MSIFTKINAPAILPLFSRVKIGKKSPDDQIDARQTGIIQGIQALEPPISYLVVLELAPHMNFWLPANEIEGITE